MDHGQVKHDHREYEDLLAAVALDALTLEEHALLRRHLETCASCRSTLGALVAAADSLPLQVEEREPSAALRARLLDQVQPEAITTLSDHREPDLTPLTFEPDHEDRRRVPAPRTRIGTPMWGLLAAAMLLVAVLAGIVVDRLVLQPDDDPELQSIALQYPQGVLSEQGALTYLPEQDVLHFHVPDLPAPPTDHLYQAWLIDEAGPRPVGIIDPETGELATTVNRVEDDTFAITVEPAPLGSAGPTSDPIIVAPLDIES